MSRSVAEDFTSRLLIDFAKDYPVPGTCWPSAAKRPEKRTTVWRQVANARGFN
jgi:hypothetical protein